MNLPAWATLVRADNPSPMTLEGTNTFVLHGLSSDATGCVVVDPGPLDAVHLDAVAAEAQRHGRVALVLLTHGHPDHSEGAVQLAERVGAPLSAVDARFCRGCAPLRHATTYDGVVTGLDLQVLATPGHTADSVCFLIRAQTGDDQAAGLLTGDTILGRGSTVVAHPDGRLGDYLASLGLLRGLDGPLTLLPGHGPAGGEVGERAAAYLEHRAERLDQVRASLAAGDTTAEQVVARVYADVDRSLWPAAEMSVRAQLDHLADLATG